MPFALWSSSYETGNPEVDRQHRQLFALVNDLQEAMAHGRGREALAPALESLVAYTLEHFVTEEALMASTCYPGLEQHRGKHAALTGQVNELLVRFTAGYLTLPRTLCRFLTDWLRHHIREEDMAFITWLKGQKP